MFTKKKKKKKKGQSQGYFSAQINVWPNGPCPFHFNYFFLKFDGHFENFMGHLENLIGPAKQNKHKINIKF